MSTNPSTTIFHNPTMAYHWSIGDVRTRQHRSATAPASSRPPFSAIPPSLIPGHRQVSATGTVTSGLLYSTPGTGNHSMVKMPATFTSDASEYYPMNPSPYHNVQPPPPPLPLPQSLLPQHMVPPLPPPPMAPLIMSPTTTPTLPPKPPPFMPPAALRPSVPRSQTQPPPLIPHGALPPLYAPSVPHPPILPPKPLGARSPSLTAMHSRVSQPNVSPRAKHSLVAKGPRDAKDAAPVASSSTNPNVGGSLGMKEEEELELALEMSVHSEREHANALLSHDEDLARALERSLLDPAPRAVHSRLRPGRLIVDSEPMTSSSSAKLLDAHPRSPNPVARVPSLSPVDVQLKEDEAFARRLEAEYGSERTTPISETIDNADPQPSESPPLPQYADIVGERTSTCRWSVS